MFVSLKNFAEERAACSENDSVSFYLLIIFTDQGDIRVFNIFSQAMEGADYVLLKFIPFKTKLLRCGHI